MHLGKMHPASFFFEARKGKMAKRIYAMRIAEELYAHSVRKMSIII